MEAKCKLRSESHGPVPKWNICAIGQHMRMGLANNIRLLQFVPSLYFDTLLQTI